MPVDEGPELVGGTAVGEGAARLEVGDHDGLVGIEDLGRLGHEVDAAEGDHFAVGLLGGLGQLEGIAHHVGEVLELVLLVVVGEDDRVALALELENRLFEVFGHGLRSFARGDIATGQD